MRLAKLHLKRIQEGWKLEFNRYMFFSIHLLITNLIHVVEYVDDDAVIDDDAVTKRLQDEFLETKGRLRKTLASSYSGHGEIVSLSRKHHRDSITCLCVSNDGNFLYSGSKDGALVKCKKKHNCANIFNVMTQL